MKKKENYRRYLGDDPASLVHNQYLAKSKNVKNDYSLSVFKNFITYCKGPRYKINLNLLSIITKNTSLFFKADINS